MIFSMKTSDIPQLMAWAKASKSVVQGPNYMKERFPMKWNEINRIHGKRISPHNPHSPRNPSVVRSVNGPWKSSSLSLRHSILSCFRSAGEVRILPFPFTVPARKAYNPGKSPGDAKRRERRSAPRSRAELAFGSPRVGALAGPMWNRKL